MAAEGLRRRVSEEPLGAGIPPHDRAAEIHGRDRHRARLDERVGVLLLALDLAEEPGIVDGQHRLRREGLQRGDDLGREGAPLAPQDHEATEQPLLADEGDREERAHAFPGQELAHLGSDELPLGLDVGHLDGLPDHPGPTHRPLAEPDGRRPQGVHVLGRDLVRGPLRERSGSASSNS